MIEGWIAIGLVLLGWWMGRQSRPRAKTATVAEREEERIREDQAAFTQLMGYSVGQAYAMEEQEGYDGL